IILLIAKYLAFLLMKAYLVFVKDSTGKRCKMHLLAGGILAAVFLAIMANAMVVSERRIDVVEVPLNLEQLYTTQSGYRIVHVSDLHLGRWLSKEALTSFIHKINKLQPDMIALTGDLVHYATAEALPLEPLLAQLQAPDGVFTVLGNHDYGTYLRWPSPEAKAENMNEMKLFFERLGWTLLNNSSKTIHTPNGAIRVAGTAHWCPRKKFRYWLDLESTFADDSAFNVTVLLTHSPQLWSKQLLPSAHHAHLTLAGHTHGLQLGFRLFGAEISPAALIFEQWAGLYYHTTQAKGKSYLYVNRGVGNVLIPFRIGMDPEITLIVLNRIE
ncbi:MAG TPA: metallophosphoesterase, partial [Bacteroidales bacterium]|nr:metallophosphoesterase [Bacteroidales bacterium]